MMTPNIEHKHYAVSADTIVRAVVGCIRPDGTGDDRLLVQLRRHAEEYISHQEERQRLESVGLSEVERAA